MATRIPLQNDIRTIKYPEQSAKSSKASAKTRRKSSQSNSYQKAKKIEKNKENSISDIQSSLREECLRLAAFLRQESHRPGFVR